MFLDLTRDVARPMREVCEQPQGKGKRIRRDRHCGGHGAYALRHPDEHGVDRSFAASGA
jgi:hypothetical protein